MIEQVEVEVAPGFVTADTMDRFQDMKGKTIFDIRLSGIFNF